MKNKNKNKIWVAILSISFDNSVNATTIVLYSDDAWGVLDCHYYLEYELGICCSFIRYVKCGIKTWNKIKNKIKNKEEKREYVLQFISIYRKMLNAKNLISYDYFYRMLGNNF